MTERGQSHLERGDELTEPPSNDCDHKRHPPKQNHDPEKASTFGDIIWTRRETKSGLLVILSLRAPPSLKERTAKLLSVSRFIALIGAGSPPANEQVQ